MTQALRSYGERSIFVNAEILRRQKNHTHTHLYMLCFVSSFINVEFVWSFIANRFICKCCDNRLTAAKHFEYQFIDLIHLSELKKKSPK